MLINKIITAEMLAEYTAKSVREAAEKAMGDRVEVQNYLASKPVQLTACDVAEIEALAKSINEPDFSTKEGFVQHMNGGKPDHIMDEMMGSYFNMYRRA